MILNIDMVVALEWVAAGKESFVTWFFLENFNVEGVGSE